MKNNEHVLKYYRWQHFWADRQNRHFAQYFWAKSYNDESEEKSRE